MSDSEKRKSIAPGRGFAVAGSPFNAVKLELAVACVAAAVLLLVIGTFVENRLAQLIVIAAYGGGAGLWIVWRVRRISHGQS
ncbi:MAG TPA: hypothetical protein ENJ19_02130 [Gammaproteobacteria bacterium]|nr:hypothetical protein [Gammaproteobacteria bacterium]